MVAESSRTKSIKLSGEKTIQKFTAVKEFLGLENDSEVVRYLINDFLRKVGLQKTPRSFVDADADAEVLEEGRE